MYLSKLSSKNTYEINKHIIIILEGENKCGKTTLAKLIVKKYKFNYQKFSQPGKDAYLDYLRFASEATGNWVIDRFHWGEIVYGNIYRRKSQLTQSKFTNLEMLLQSKNTVVIYCYDLVKKISNRFKSENEEWAESDKIKLVLKSYDDIIKKMTILPVVRHRITSNLDLTTGKKLKLIIDSFKQKPESKFKNLIIGNLNSPKLLLVGHQHNDNNRSSYNRLYGQFKMPFDFGNSAECIYETLMRSKIPLNDVAITNAIDCSNLREKIKFVNPIKIIALGRAASRELKNIPHVEVNHPGFEKRFFNISRDYVDNLRQIYASLR